jgi:putative spermidine/putrescine transport system permease protein
VEAADAVASAPKRSVGRRLAGLFHGRSRLQVGALLSAPVAWLVIGYLGSLAVLLAAGFWTVDALSGEVSQTFSLDSFNTLLDDSVYRTVAQRTVLIAAAVTITDALLAFPIAFYMAKVASRRQKAVLLVAVLMPLWSFYLVKAYAWRIILSDGGVLNWALEPFGISGPGLEGTLPAYLTFTYLWLPFMIIPIYAGLERIPDSLLSASEDLGDYITPQLVTSTQFIGNVIQSNITNNLPLASAYATVPIAVMVVYLLIARRLGAFEHL